MSIVLETEEKIFLAQSADFQKILAEDVILKDLSEWKIDRTEECFMLLSVARGCLQAEKGPPVPGVLTPALWGLLWSLGNAYTEDPEKITEKDTGIFLYLLNTGRLDLSSGEIPLLAERAETFCRERAVDYPEAAALLIRMIRRSFQMLELIPNPEKETHEGPFFDLHWLTSLCSIAAAESGHTMTRIMFRMPLSFCFYCFIHHLRKQDPRGVIRRRTGKENVTATLERIRFLGRKFCDENRESSAFSRNNS